jgi:hypothetical protein
LLLTPNEQFSLRLVVDQHVPALFVDLDLLEATHRRLHKALLIVATRSNELHILRAKSHKCSRRSVEESQLVRLLPTGSETFPLSTVSVNETGDGFCLFILEKADLLSIVLLQLGDSSARGVQSFADLQCPRAASIAAKRVDTLVLKRTKDLVSLLGAFEVVRIDKFVAVASQDHKDRREIGHRDNRDRLALKQTSNKRLRIGRRIIIDIVNSGSHKDRSVIGVGLPRLGFGRRLVHTPSN